MFAQTLYSSDVVIVCAAAVCSCYCCSLGVAHPIYSSSWLGCATSVGCCSSKFAPILGFVTRALLLILELLCLLVQLQALMLPTFKTD